MGDERNRQLRGPRRGTIYIGGQFTQVGPATGSAVPINVATGGLPASFPKVVGNVRAHRARRGGGWYIGGSFTSVGGIPRSNLARVAADLSVSTWNPNANFYVLALAVSGSTVYAGGGFTSIGGQTRHYIAALDAVTGAATAFNPNANNEVYALAVSGSTDLRGREVLPIGAAGAQLHRRAGCRDR